MKLKSLAAFAAVMLAVSPAFAETKSALTPDEVMTILGEAGLSPSLSQDVATGAPVFLGSAGNINFIVRALNCSGAPAACENLLFLANFDLGRPVTPDDYLVINKFNDSQLFGRAYVLANTNQVGVEYVLEMGGGVSTEHIAQNVARWANIIGAFLSNFQSGQS
jgi:hypothetical protein